MGLLFIGHVLSLIRRIGACQTKDNQGEETSAFLEKDGNLLAK
jgi:hypothetical protein